MPRRPASRSAAQADAEKIVKLLQARATAARAEAVWADSTVEIAGATPRTRARRRQRGITAVAAAGSTEPLTSTWSRRALAALLIPALILLIVVLL